MDNLSLTGSLVGSFSGPLTGPSSIAGDATHLLICLHGFGADGNDLIGLASPLQAALATQGIILGVACPHAPSVTPFGPGRQWFSDKGWSFKDPSGLQQTLPLLNSYVAELCAAHSIEPTHVVLAGFSQGAMTLLALLPQLTPQAAGIIALSGALTMPPSVPCANPMPVLLIHGTADDVLPADASVAAEQWLTTHGHSTQLHLLDDLGHGIDNRVLAHMVVWLQALWQQG